MTPDQLKHSNQFNRRHILLKLIDKKVCEILEDVCHLPSPISPKKGVPNIVRIESRIKDEKSFLDKIDRPGKAYTDPINDITDLVGFRIITFYKRDVELVEEIIRKSGDFYVDEAHTQDTFERLQPNEFGYLSKHFVVKLSHKRLEMSEFRPKLDELKRQKFEIQVRTLLQHAWATLSHKLTYKAENEAPRKLRRKVAMLSALLETADDASMSLQGLRQKIQKKYRKKIREGNLEGILIDAESVSVYLHEAPIAKEWWDTAQNIGWKSLLPDPVIPHGNSPEEIAEAEVEKDKKEKALEKRQLSYLMAVISKGKVEKLSELDEILKKEKDERSVYLEKLYYRLDADKQHLRATIHDIIRAIVLNEKNHVINSSDLEALDYDEALVKIYSDLCDLG